MILLFPKVPSRTLSSASILLAGLILACSVPSSTAAQMQPPVVGQDSGQTRSVQGLVVNPAGEAIAGAIVLLKNTKTLQVRSYIAQSDGSYRFFGLSTDINYQVRAQAEGLSSKVKTVSVFNSHKLIKLDLKVEKKLKS